MPQRVAYKGMMLDAVPNLAFAIGYTNASWTLKVDLVASLRHPHAALHGENGYAIVTPRLPSGPMATSPFIDMTSGYFERARHACRGRATGPRGGCGSTTSRTQPCTAGP